MPNGVWYNHSMPVETEKKTRQIGVKISPSLEATLEEICKKEDRPIGYVMRELAVRGLYLYRKDGKIRDETTQTIPVLKKGAR